MHPDLFIKPEKIIEILENALQVCLVWLMSESQIYEQKVIAEGKEL
jgi:hypothetical protein